LKLFEKIDDGDDKNKCRYFIYDHL